VPLRQEDIRLRSGTNMYSILTLFLVDPNAPHLLKKQAIERKGYARDDTGRNRYK
jgi:hypothetical protein